MSPTLKTGTYVIVNKKSGTAFDLSGQDKRSIIGFTKHGRENQKWTVKDCGGGRSYTIQNCSSKKWLDVDVPNSFNNGERVVALETNTPRKWDLRYDDHAGGWRIFIDNTNINVDLSDHGNPADCTPVTLWGKWAGENQVWHFEETSLDPPKIPLSSGGAYIITNKKAGTALDLSGQDQKSIIGFTTQKSDNQKWRIQDTGSGWTFQNVYKNNYLDVEGPLQNGSKVVAVETGNPRTWNIFPDEKDNSAYRIFVRDSNLNVDLSDNGNATPGTPVAIWGKLEGENQVWRFEQV